MNRLPRADHLMQYIDMVNTHCMFIKVELTGNWELHLQPLHDMQHTALPQMPKLQQQQHPDVYREFQVYFKLSTEIFVSWTHHHKISRNKLSDKISNELVA